MAGATPSPTGTSVGVVPCGAATGRSGAPLPEGAGERGAGDGVGAAEGGGLGVGAGRVGAGRAGGAG
ncbi:MAG: hypothetical protein ABL874_10100, partial [Sphingopyxis sp.]